MAREGPQSVSLFGGASSEVRRCNCSAVVCLSIYLSIYSINQEKRRGFSSSVDDIPPRQTWRRAFRCASNAQNSLAAGSCACRAPPAPQHCRDAPRHVLVVGAGGRARRRPRRQRRGRPDLRVRSLCGKAAAQRRRPIRPPARPASVRLSPGQPPASTSLGSNRQLRAGDTGPVSNIGTQRKANPSRAACGSC